MEMLRKRKENGRGFVVFRGFRVNIRVFPIIITH